MSEFKVDYSSTNMGFGAASDAFEIKKQRAAYDARQDVKKAKAVEDKKTQDLRDTKTGVKDATEEDVAFQSGIDKANRLIGPDGLTKLRDDTDVQGVLERSKDLSQGLSSKEMSIQRDRATSAIGESAQVQSRSLLAKFGQAGIKGGVAGQGLREVAQDAVGKRIGFENDMLLQNIDLKRSGLKDYAKNLGDVKTFDIGQEQAEIDIRQQMGNQGSSEFAENELRKSNERISNRKAEAQSAAANKDDGK